MNLVKNILNRQINGKLKFIKISLFFKKNDWRYYYNILRLCKVYATLCKFKVKPATITIQ